MRTWGSLLLLGLLIGCNPPLNEVVTIEQGVLEGKYAAESGVFSYKGIPFAQPPVHGLRWKAPQAPQPWQGTLDATSFGPICEQGDPVPFLMWTQEFIAPDDALSEDCLTLNIWTKAGDLNAKRPVIVFIHGGGFSSGSGSVPIYDGTAMAQKDVVFVTINYRVGILGFLAHPELSAESSEGVSGNYGLLDQIAALTWVQKNIEHFGGDPKNVTIAGQSAGAFSVNYLVASPLAKGLFHRAIAESGGSILQTGTRGSALHQAENRGINLAAELGANSLSALRKLDAQTLLAHNQGFSPIIDGHVFPTPLYEMFTSGNYNQVPVILGWNANEGALWGGQLNADAFKASMSERFGDYSENVLEVFPARTDEEALESQALMGSLQTFGVQAWAWTKLQNQTSGQPVFVYHFERNLPHTPTQQNYGAFHTGEVPYAYNNLATSARPWAETDHELADKMSDYWANFAKTGNPNGGNLFTWQPTTKNEFPAMYFGDKIHPGKIPNISQLEVLYTFTEQQITESK